MEYTLDNPGFLDTIAGSEDVPRSSTSGELQQRSCARCPSRMSSIDRDKHLFCIKCRGYECSVDLRCDECKDWSKEEMLAHEKIRKSLASKNKGRGKSSSSSSKSSKKPASLPSTSVPLDIDDRLREQHDSLVKEMDDRMELLSSSLLGQIKALIGGPDSQSFDHDRVAHNASKFPRRDSVDSGPTPPQQRSRSAGEVGRGTQRASVARDESVSRARYEHAPRDIEDQDDLPPGDGCARDGQGYAYDDDRFDDEDDELKDREQATEPPIDRAFARLVDFIYGRLPQSAPPAAPRCEYEKYFAVNDPPEPACKFMRLYPRVSEIQASVHEYEENLARKSRPLFRVLPSRRRALSIGDNPDFCKQQFLNSDFSRICRSRSVSKSRMASVSLADLERLDRVARMILAGDSQCFWFLSALLVQLKEDGYQPLNPALFDKSISSLSSALATQTNASACLSEFVTTKRRESYLSHSSITLPDSLKRDLLVAPGTDSLLFNQPLLSAAIENMKEDSLLSSTSSLVSISKAAGRSKPQGGANRYSSPLDAPRPGTSGSRKRSSSPSRRGSKRGRGGRGAAPSSSRGRGFRR